jgi:hypothetical protein
VDDDRLPRDPDLDAWDDVPTELMAANGKRVTITGRDMERDRLHRSDGVLVVVPVLFAHARRLRDGYFARQDGDDGDTADDDIA